MAKTDIQYDPNSVTGFHIYEDDKGRKVYYQPRKLTGYVIQSENVKTYRLLANRYVIAALAAIVCYIVFGDQGLSIWICGAVGILTFLVMQYRFHMVFLPNLVQLHHFVPKSKPKMTEAMAEQDAWRLLCKGVLYPIFGILLLIEFYQKDSSISVLLLGIVILGFSLVYALINIKAYVFKRSHPDIDHQPIVNKNKKNK